MAMTAIVKKEFTDFISSPKFWIVFFIFVLMMLSSAYQGFQNYSNGMEQYQQQIKKQTIFEEGSKPPSIFSMEIPKPSLLNSFFGLMESFSLIGALLALTLGYDAISKERKRGTLKVLLSYPIYRDSVINGKFISGILALTLTVFFTTSILIGIIIYEGILVTNEEIIRMFLFVFSSLIYMILFLGIGIFLSVILKEESSSLFASMIVWIMSAIIYPILIIAISDIIVPVDLESQMFLSTKERNLVMFGRERLKFTLLKISPSFNFRQLSRSMLSPYKPLFAETSFGNPESITFMQSLSYSWSNAAILLGLLVVTFVASYIIFMRQDVR